MEKQTVPEGTVCFIMEIIEDDCPFLSDQKGTKESPGDGSDERLRAAGAHSHLSPGPPDYGSGSLWPDSPFRRAKLEWLVCSIPGPLGPGSIKIWERLLSNVPRLVSAYSFGAWVIGRAWPTTTDQPPWLCQGRRCHASELVHQILHTQGLVARGQEGPATQILPAG